MATAVHLTEAHLKPSPPSSGGEKNVALRADTARHFITGATILIFSAAAIGTAMKSQDTSPASDLPLAAELPARQATAAARVNRGGPHGLQRYRRFRLGHRREARHTGGFQQHRCGIALARSTAVGQRGKRALVG